MCCWDEGDDIICVEQRYTGINLWEIGEKMSVRNEDASHQAKPFFAVLIQNDIQPFEVKNAVSLSE